MCTPLVTWPIGTSSTALSGHRSRHIPRATSPCRRLTPFAARLVRSANWLTPNGSVSSSGRVRPSRITSAGSASMSRVTPASASSTWSAGYVSLPAGTGVCVVKIVFVRAAASPSASGPPCARAASSEMNDAWPSLRCRRPGSIPIASSARTPPTPSSTYWARRASGSPMYSREAIQRAARSFSGRSVSSR